MKKAVSFAAAMVLGLFVTAQSAFAWTVVGNYGDTGWQTFSHTFDAPWSGTIAFGAANYGNADGDSVLLLDRLAVTDAAGVTSIFSSFETGLDGYTDYSLGGAGVVDQATAYDGTVYSPRDGSYMAILTPYGGWSMEAWGGFNGVLLALNESYSFETNESFSFDWAFLAMDEMPNEDFSLFFHQESGDPQGLEYDELGRIGGSSNTVPEPASMALLGLGLAGLARLRKKTITQI